MIVVVARLDQAAGTAVARLAAAAGGRVELVARVPPGTTGDARLAELAAAGVGHAATLRSAGPDLEPADLELALRYLPDVRVVVLAASPDLVGTAVEAASWSSATLLVVAEPPAASREATGDGGRAADEAAGEEMAAGAASDRLLVVTAPARDPDGAFAGVIAELARRLDAGADLAAAWAATAGALGLERLGPPPVVQPASGGAASAG